MKLSFISGVTLKIKKVFDENPFLFFFVGFLMQLFLYWPGIAQSDSQVQYQMAISGVYSDHHPAFMSFVWRYLDMIYPGPGLLLALNTALLHGGAYIFYQAFKKDNKAWTFVLIPWIPGVMAYGAVILKDIAFAYSFLLCCGLLTKEFMTQKKMSLIENVLFFAILFYGVSVKFQAQYLAPILIVWYVQNKQWSWCRSFFKKFLVMAGMAALFWGSPDDSE